MAIQTSAIFAGFRGNVNRQLLFRQCAGKTVVSKFPDRSRVIYSEQQKRAQKRFAEALGFARIVIQEPLLRDNYSIKAALLGYRSTWNLAIAEYMSDQPLTVKRKKIKFDKSIIRQPMGSFVKMNLYTFAEEAETTVLKAPPRLKLRPERRRLKLRDPAEYLLPVLPELIFNS